MGYERPMYFSDPNEFSMEDSLMGLAALSGQPPKDNSPISGSLSMAKLSTFYQPPWFKNVEKVNEKRSRYVACLEVLSGGGQNMFLCVKYFSRTLKVKIAEVL